MAINNYTGFGLGTVYQGDVCSGEAQVLQSKYLSPTEIAIRQGDQQQDLFRMKLAADKIKQKQQEDKLKGIVSKTESRWEVDSPKEAYEEATKLDLDVANKFRLKGDGTLNFEDEKAYKTNKENINTMSIISGDQKKYWKDVYKQYVDDASKYQNQQVKAENEKLINWYRDPYQFIKDYSTDPLAIQTKKELEDISSKMSDLDKKLKHDVIVWRSNKSLNLKQPVKSFDETLIADGYLPILQKEKGSSVETEIGDNQTETISWKGVDINTATDRIRGLYEQSENLKIASKKDEPIIQKDYEKYVNEQKKKGLKDEFGSMEAYKPRFYAKKYTFGESSKKIEGNKEFSFGVGYDNNKKPIFDQANNVFFKGVSFNYGQVGDVSKYSGFSVVNPKGISVSDRKGTLTEGGKMVGKIQGKEVGKLGNVVLFTRQVYAQPIATKDITITYYDEKGNVLGDKKIKKGSPIGQELITDKNKKALKGNIRYEPYVDGVAVTKDEQQNPDDFSKLIKNPDRSVLIPLSDIEYNLTTSLKSPEFKDLLKKFKEELDSDNEKDVFDDILKKKDANILNDL